uniref:Uncharacterized protein n=1 Tax=Avena sativa TaxID=4498 RepID=A0ACD5V1D7_AVESA
MDIQRIRQQIIHLNKSNGVAPLPLPSPPSTFAIVAALAWTCFARCKPFAENDDVFFFFFADVRGRLNPPINRRYMGACLTGCRAKLPAHELRGEHALVAAVSALQDEVRKMKNDPMAGWDFVTSLFMVDMDRLMHVSGSSGFEAYEVADFGWGKPRRIENARMNDDGHVALMRAKSGHGVQLSVSLLLPMQMDEFKVQFLKLLQG